LDLDVAYQLQQLEDGKNDIPKYFYKLAGTIQKTYEGILSVTYLVVN
jgi:hypothetical protein